MRNKRQNIVLIPKTFSSYGRFIIIFIFLLYLNILNTLKLISNLIMGNKFDSVCVENGRVAKSNFNFNT